jgi:hypothetical protein
MKFLLIDYLEKGATITAKYYTALLNQLLNKLKQQLVSNVEASFQKESCSFKTMLLLTRQPLHILVKHNQLATSQSLWEATICDYLVIKIMRFIHRADNLNAEKQSMLHFHLHVLTNLHKARGSVVVKALCYKQESRGFDSR